MLPQWIVEKKRDGGTLSEEEIRSFIAGFADGAIPDYQMSALAMAVFFRGMNMAETTFLTDAMMRSGRVIDPASLPRPSADKHSTGGVGDKISLILAPLVAACGVSVPMISGRGLGITGGTLDKMGAILGYRTDLSIAEFVGVLEKCGCSIIGQTDDLAPADRKLYALRDVTGTVPSIPLITASIMSKKLAEGAGTLVMDVKWGRGAFMKSQEDAMALASSLIEVGSCSGRNMAVLVTDMNQPLGRTAGNAPEVVESVETLMGRGPADVVQLALELGAAMLTLSGAATDRESALAALQKALDSGEALSRFARMIELHGGNPDVAADPSLLPSAPHTVELKANRSGFIRGVDADMVGRACLVLGAGRAKVTDTVSPVAGVSRMLKPAEEVRSGQCLLAMHTERPAALEEAGGILSGAFEIGDDPPQAAPLIAWSSIGGNPA